MGIKEQIAFPEISIDKISKITGMDITFVTNTNSDEDAMILLKELGMPFKMNDRYKKKVSENLNKNEEEQVVESIEGNENDEFEKNKNIES